MPEQKYKFLQFKDFSYAEALNNYADMQNYFKKAISQAYDKAYGASDYNKRKDILEKALSAINVFEYSEKLSGKKLSSFPADSELKRLDENFVQIVRDAAHATDTFMNIIKDKYYVSNRDEFANKYGKDVRLGINQNAAVEQWKLTTQDRQNEETRKKYWAAQKELEQKIKPRKVKTESMDR